jgi:hypothetical protein
VIFKFLAKPKGMTRKQEAAYQFGERASQAMTAAIDEYLDQQLTELQSNLLAVLSLRLRTIHDEPGHRPEQVARIEWDIFLGHVQTLPNRVKQDFPEDIIKWQDLASTIGIRELFDAYVQKTP